MNNKILNCSLLIAIFFSFASINLKSMKIQLDNLDQVEQIETLTDKVENQPQNTKTSFITLIKKNPKVLALISATTICMSGYFLHRFYKNSNKDNESKKPIIIPAPKPFIQKTLPKVTLADIFSSDDLIIEFKKFYRDIEQLKIDNNLQTWKRMSVNLQVFEKLLFKAKETKDNENLFKQQINYINNFFANSIKRVTKDNPNTTDQELESRIQENIHKKTKGNKDMVELYSNIIEKNYPHIFFLKQSEPCISEYIHTILYLADREIAKKEIDTNDFFGK